MKSFFSVTIIVLLVTKTSFAQIQDSTKHLNEVKVSAYLEEQPLISLPSSAYGLHKENIRESTVSSLLPALNNVSGITMEERSPGSYRLSIRGSLLRSSFGVRNIKVYYDDFPLTDAGGNTYLNLIDQNTLRSIEILKGPDGSLFGANSGGVILLNSFSEKQGFEGGVNGGSYGQFSQYVNGDIKNGKHSMSFNQAYQRSDGYRVNTATERLFVQTQQRWQYHKKGEIKFSGFYADMNYQTPGGLTLAQMQENPKAARANASELGVGIFNKTFFGGLSHQRNFGERFKHVISISGIISDFKNPFFTNYETRKENSFSLRTYLELKNKPTNAFNYQWNIGWEFQNGSADIINYKNSAGTAGDLTKADQLKNQTQFIFNRFAFRLGQKFKGEASLSVNFGNMHFENMPQSTELYKGKTTFDPILMPRISASYLLTPHLAARGIISRGYSLPTTAEVRADDAIINPDLKAEEGWNYETGIRLNNNNHTLFMDVNAYYYNMTNAIVKRVNPQSESYFINAGGTKQKGLEWQINAILFHANHFFINTVNLNSGITYSDFKFTNYVVNTENYSGNRLTGVPKFTFSNALNIDFIQNLSLFGQYRYNGKTSLNDASTIFADDYHLVMLKAGWKKKLNNKTLQFYFGADNVLNQTYSLGNDLNAFGNRFYNPAAKRTYFGGMRITF